MSYCDIIDSPVGRLFVGGSGAGLHRIEFVNEDGEEAVLAARLEDDCGEPAEPDPRAAAAATTQLREYFTGARREFELTLAPRGTEFQLSVWKALLDVPYGETASYGEIAAAVGRPSASRAVGAANGRNPISIVAPCHRIVGANGSLTGYGGGLDRKAWLLNLEASALRPARVA
ncbi:MAG: methylated-DNA--[protein]-cysteine S-methyltransferase [Dehalococcoidia bacterium]|jgi:methylated-DNA-[protein]-cysteine S-methyltransferase|nr:methylated-DNA--[protein]-cysteine S-methyltransferase [Dehalococcoidia bacterium]